jgi:phosphoglycolate phosphatase
MVVGPKVGPVVHRLLVRAFDHVVFDLDGTLVDSRADLVRAVNHTLGSFGRPPLGRDRIVSYVGEGARRLVERALATEDADAVERGLAVFRAFYARHLLDETRAYPEIPELLDDLGRCDCRLSVLTNKPEAMSRAILDGLGLLPRFVAVLGGDSLPTRKPDPAGLLHLAGRTSIERRRVLLVGDSPVDVATARAAGVPFCGAEWGFDPARLRRARPDHSAPRPRDVARLVGTSSDASSSGTP